MTKKVVVILTLCLFVCLTTLAAQEKLVKPVNKEAAKKMDKASKAWKNKELDKALPLFQEVIQLEPTYAPAYYYCGNIHLQKKQNDQALPMLEKAVQLQPDYAAAVNEYVHVLNATGRDLSAQGQPEKAMPYFQRIVDLPGLDAVQKSMLMDAAFNLGISAFQAQKFDQSVAAFTKLLAMPGFEAEAKRQFVLVQYMLGINLNVLGKSEESNGHLLKYLELTAADAPSQFTAIAAYLVAKNDYALLDGEITKVRNDKSVTDLRARVQELAKARNRIQEMAQKSLSIKADTEDAYVLLGNYYYLMRDLDQAIAQYKTLIEKFPASSALADYNAFLANLDKEKNPPPPPPPARGKKK